MLDFFISLDHQLFYLVNSTFSSEWLDLFFLFWTDIQKNIFFILVFLLVFSFCAYRFSKWRGLVYFFLSFVLVGVVDKLAHFIKPFFSRARPFNSDLNIDVIVRGIEQGGFSFPSGHATDAFFLSTFLSLFFPRLKYVLFTFSFLTAYSRVYCGVHFPLDVIFGAFIGGLCAFCCYKLIVTLEDYWFKER